ncbi:uncharacterized protein I206_106776 [Kwoniella pini CBS 10737]|uniref:DUF3604 domain-containing protein n=1 Tax=Kwoniella pini CBS 10737 TaxID=1296096 RepID=A0AAJ8LBV6_9TREE
MRTLSEIEREDIIGTYTAPTGLYELVKTTPNGISCWLMARTAAHLHGRFIRTCRWSFYSDWALFQTSDPKAANYISAEYEACPLLPGQLPSTVQALNVRFDQKGHERPFQKSIIVDIVDGFLNVGDKIHIRLGDRRMGGAGTRIQTFVEKDFRIRFYVDPVGTSRFAAVPGDVILQILSGPPASLVVLAPRLVKTSDKQIKVVIRAEDAWGNTVNNHTLSVTLSLINQSNGKVVQRRETCLPQQGWSTRTEMLSLGEEGSYRIQAVAQEYPSLSGSTLFTVKTDAPSVYYADLHVHSDDTVGTNDSLYNFSYAKECAGLDVVGYTANDFNITKENWNATVQLIDQLNTDNEFVIYPGTEWCGNTAVGGDHNVVFLDERHREFPYDRHGNVARSFEWNDQMQTDTIEPGTWPIDELYATYAHAPESHLLIPHIGGRRANLGWHHPQLERLIEVGSAWGHFEWFLRDAVARGYKLGVSANSDEHRGRCGGGVPGTAVFGTRGGLTGIIANRLDRPSIASALRARHTFATTGQRLVGLTWIDDNFAKGQGDEIVARSSKDLTQVGYRFFGQEAGFESIEAFGWNGTIMKRDLQEEVGYSEAHIRVSWGGARIKDRYREATWKGSVTVTNGIIRGVKRISVADTHPEETQWVNTDGSVGFTSSTSGDVDGIILDISWFGLESGEIHVQGTIEGYVGNALDPPPFKHCPTFSITGQRSGLYSSKPQLRKNLGGVDMFVAIERVSRPGQLPVEIDGVVDIAPKNGPHGFSPVCFVATQADGAKVWTSPIFVQFQ